MMIQKAYEKINPRRLSGTFVLTKKTGSQLSKLKNEMTKFLIPRNSLNVELMDKKLEKIGKNLNFFII